MKIFDTVDVRIVRIGDSIGIYFPMEYDSLEGFKAEFSAAVDGKDIVFIIKPHIRRAVHETVNELWKDISILFSKIGDIGEVPWDQMEIVWAARHEYEEKVPISADEVIQHRHIRESYGHEEFPAGDMADMRKSIHNTMDKLCELASLRLEFKDRNFARAFGQGVANKFSFTYCDYGMYAVICQIFSDEFDKVDDDKFWKLTSPKAQDAVKVAYDRIKYLEEHPDEFQKERERIQRMWGFPLKPA